MESKSRYRWGLSVGLHSSILGVTTYSLELFLTRTSSQSVTQ